MIKSTTPPHRICFLLASSLLEGIDRGMVLEEAGWGSAFTLGIDELYPGLEKLCLQPWASRGEVILSLYSTLVKPLLEYCIPA